MTCEAGGRFVAQSGVLVPLGLWSSPELSIPLNELSEVTMGFLDQMDPNYFSAQEKIAFEQGSTDCRKSWSENYSTSQTGRFYQPPVGLEVYYEAGWKDTANRIESAQDRKRGRQNSLKFIASGSLILVVGCLISWFLYKDSGEREVTIAFGAMGVGAINLVIGIFMAIFGWNNE